ncbi:MAG: hypothetical protein C0467_18645 [Planctomycetaceae bacterium]|nr:hypothetical protein [Planctomycetaceae bacterium]
MIQLKDVLTIDNGAKFLNADLHVHSYGASADVRDKTMTPDAIIESAVTQGISLLAITDHNTDKNVAVAQEYALKHAGSILVLPGVEISTSHGHLLVYFSPAQASHVGKLMTKIDLQGVMGAQDSHTAMSMADVIREAERLGGLCVAAHIDREGTGFDKLHDGFPNWKKDILTSSGLYGLEVDKSTNLNMYTPDDDQSPQGIDRKRLAGLRNGRQETAGRARLAMLQGSDAHSLVNFTPRSPVKPWSRIKMSELSFEAFKVAMIDPEARVRAVAQLPKSIPRVRGMHCAGGFLDAEIFHYSDNLNCFIGGRGTGKSSAIRSLAYGLGAHEGFGDLGHCPDTISIWCEDANGVLYRYDRNRGGDITVRAKEDGSITEVPQDSFRIEYYGQGELADVAKDPLSNPGMFQDFLDRHIILRDLNDQEDTLVNRLRENAAQLIPVEADFAQLPGKMQSLAEIDKKLKVAEEGNLKEIVGIQTRLAAEKALLATLEKTVQEYRQGFSLSVLERNFDSMCQTAGALTGEPDSQSALADVKARIAESNAFVLEKQAELNARTKTAAEQIAASLVKLKTVHGKIDGDIAGKLADLRTKGLAGNLGEIQTLLRSKQTISQGIATIEQRRTHLNTLRQARQKLLDELTGIRNEMTKRRKEQLTLINSNLTKTITDYTVFVKYEPSGIIEQFFGLVSSVMHGSYYQDSHCRSLCQKITPLELAAFVLNRDVQGIARAAGIAAEWAAEIQKRFFTWKNAFDLQAMAKPPCPVIVVKTKSTPSCEIPVIQLSDGQRHTILLTIAMLAESNLPLVIDQPEDDLDSGFIFSSIVATLRTIKEKRQVILVTHNANIAILGDSEMIFPMKRENDKGKAICRGSIDKIDTKESAQKILEGGELAFKKRQAIYGY